jgi:hypothetical protein
MIAWARLAKGKVYHGWDARWPKQRVYNSLCGLWRKHYEIGGLQMTRKCKTCARMETYHMKRPPPVVLRVRLDMGPKGAIERYKPNRA